MASPDILIEQQTDEPAVGVELPVVTLQPFSAEATYPVQTIFGCPIAQLRMAEAVDEVYRLIACRGTTCRYVVTPNVDHVVMLQEHRGLRRAYRDAALVVADGMPVVLASRLLGKRLPERITGTDLLIATLEAASHRGGLRVYLLGALPGVAVQAAGRIHERWPAVQVVGTNSPPFGFEHDPEYIANLLEDIRNCQPDLLVVGLGAPKQELFVHAHRQDIDALAMCVGAAIDFIAGNKQRAPAWMQRWGLEWLHRVATEPRRLLRRYLRDAWRFPPLVWRDWRNKKKQRDGSQPS